MALSLRLPNDSLVLKAYASLIGAAPGSTAFTEHKAFIAANGQNAYVSALNSLFANVSNADLATAIRGNLGLTTVVTQATTEAFLAANASNRVGAIFAIADVLATTTDASLATAKAAYNTGIDASYNYSVVATNYQGMSIATLTTVSTTFELGLGQDKLTGTTGADLFNAYIIDSKNTLQSGDMLNGGTGVDTLFADIGNSQSFAITAHTTDIETVKIRAQSTVTDNTNGNNVSSNGFNNTVQIDAQRMAGVTQWESNNSRSDVIIEDVRIADSQKTSDITIAMVETDPGNVDFGVYFDQLSLRNASAGNTTLTIKLMDTGAAATAATAATPLLNNPYDQFKLGINGVLTTIQLDKTAVAAADTYAALLAVFQTALTGTGVTAALGADFTITDPITTTQVTGQSIVLTGGSGVVITAPAGSGWYNTTGASVPPTSNIYTTYNDATSTTVELVTSKVILDDVGRGSTGGDLVIGGLSVGDTSTSRGVERFEIEVRDNSKLQTINSTNNALREVVITNGTTSNTVANAYTTTVTNEGDLTVNGKVGNDATLAGVETGSAVGVHDTTFGFTDVRLIDASGFKGKLAFTAQVTTDSLSKYVNLADTQSSPTADVAGSGNVNFNVKGANFAYTGGNDNDTIAVTIDSAVAASTTLTGQSDFSIVIDGGAGNDAISTNIGGNETAAWVLDQRQNKNVTINAGDGDDTVNTPGAGDIIINAGAGSDTVYTDNIGNKATWVVNATNTDLANLSTAGATSTFLYKGQLVVSLSGAAAGGGVTAGVADSVASNFTNGFEVVVDIPTGSNYEVTQLHLNQAIKAAINDNAVLKKLAVAKDGPAGTLTISTLIDGVFAAADLSMTVRTQTLTGAEETAALTALKLFAKDSTLVAADVSTTNTTSAGTLNGITGMTTGGAVLGQNVTDVAATAEVATLTAVGLGVGETQTVNGLILTEAGGAGATAGAVELALETGLSSATVTVSGAYTSAWTVGTGAAGTVVYTSSTTGNVTDLAVGGSDATPSTIVTVDGTAATTALVNATGSQGTADTDNTIDLGAGTSDVLVLSTSAAANETIKVAGSDLGLKTIVNFTDGAAGSFDKLDFTSILSNMESASGSTESATRIATTFVQAATNAAVDANSVTVIGGVTFSATETFAGLTAANLLAAINSTNTGAADWGTAGLTAATLDVDNTYVSSGVPTSLVGGIGKAIVMIENTGNEGEYKVFELTFNGLAANATKDFSAATLVGTFDFGNSIALNAANLV